MTQANSAGGRSTGFYVPELDSLRCLAVVGVMIAHFSTLSQYADWGLIGVRLFFVLSGFLITNVLLNARHKVESGKASVGGALRQFFVRRIFRLWPLYYGTLLAAYAFKLAGTYTNILWHLLFATNIYVFIHHDWPVLLAHFWTLAVEQQYYLICPLAILLLPRRFLPSLLTITLIAGPLTRALLLLRAQSSPDYDYVLLPCCFDFFALGGFVAWWQQQGTLPGIARRSTLKAIILATIAWIVIGTVLKNTGHRSAGWTVYDPLFQAFGFAALIAFLLQNPRDPATRWLRLPILVYIGQISYGVYIYHNFMHRVAPSILRRLIGENYFHSQTLHVLYMMTLSIAVASVSYYLLEEPLRKFGRRIA